MFRFELPATMFSVMVSLLDGVKTELVHVTTRSATERRKRSVSHIPYILFTFRSSLAVNLYPVIQIKVF
jgi:hypothetical protein